MKFRAVELNKLDVLTINNIREWRNSDFVRSKMFNQHIISEEEHMSYVNNIKNNPDKGLFVFYIDDVPFAVYQYEINRAARSVTNGSYLIDEDYSVFGYGTILGYMMQLIIYKYLDVDIIYCEIIDYNEKAIRAQRQVNGKRVETLKNHIEIDGVLHDVYRYAHQVMNPDCNSREAKIISDLIDMEPIENMIIM